ncbi:MAG: hypothetical protein HY235_30235 [Acidobacteria bacterium]|nr:hypothetical protein [Acidobacteriota bacterium]
MIRKLKQCCSQAISWFTPERLERAVVLVKVCLVIGIFLCPVWLLHLYVYSARVRELPLSLALSFLTAQGSTVVLQLVISCALKKREEVRSKSAEQALPAIRACLAAQAGGDHRHKELQRYSVWHQAEVEQCLTAFLSAVDGHARERLTQLAIHLGFRARWQQLAVSGGVVQKRHAAHCLGLLSAWAARPVLRQMLSDRSPLVQSAASLSLLKLGAAEDIEDVFRFSLQAQLLVRAMLAGALRPHALLLRERAIPRELTGKNPRPVLTALEMAEAWRVPLSLASLIPLLLHADPRIRATAIRLLPLNGLDDEVELWVLAGLADPQETVRAAAASAASRMRMISSIPALERLIDEAGDELMNEALRALATMGSEGWEILERNILAPDRRIAAKAAEALAMAQIKPALAHL